MKLFFKRTIKYLPIIFYVLTIAFIIYQSALPSEKSSAVSNGVQDVFTKPYDKDSLSDMTQTEINKAYQIYNYLRKILGHFGLYFICGFFGLLSFQNLKNKSNAILINLTVGLPVACLSEFIQLFNDRSATFSDCVINYQGYVSASLAIFLILTIISIAKRKPPFRYALILVAEFSAVLCLLIAFVAFSDKKETALACFVIFMIISLVSLSITWLLYNFVAKEIETSIK